MKSLLPIAAMLIAGPAVAAQGQILARCGASHGQAYYPHDDKPSWEHDALGSGSFVFIVDSAGRPNLLTKDTRGGVHDSRKDDGDVRFANRMGGDFGIIVTYADQSVIETYNVTTDHGLGLRGFDQDMVTDRGQQIIHREWLAYKAGAVA